MTSSDLQAKLDTLKAAVQLFNPGKGRGKVSSETRKKVDDLKAAVASFTAHFSRDSGGASSSRGREREREREREEDSKEEKEIRRERERKEKDKGNEPPDAGTPFRRSPPQVKIEKKRKIEEEKEKINEEKPKRRKREKEEKKKGSSDSKEEKSEKEKRREREKGKEKGIGSPDAGTSFRGWTPDPKTRITKKKKKTRIGRGKLLSLSAKVADDKRRQLRQHAVSVHGSQTMARRFAAHAVHRIVGQKKQEKRLKRKAKKEEEQAREKQRRQEEQRCLARRQDVEEQVTRRFDYDDNVWRPLKLFGPTKQHVKHMRLEEFNSIKKVWVMGPYHSGNHAMGNWLRLVGRPSLDIQPPIGNVGSIVLESGKYFWKHTSPKEPLPLPDSELEGVLIISLVRHPLEWFHAMTRRDSYELRSVLGRKIKHCTEGYLKKECRVYTGEPGTHKANVYHDAHAGAVYKHALELWAEHAYFNSFRNYKPQRRARWPVNVFIKYEDLLQHPRGILEMLYNVGLDVDIEKMEEMQTRKWWPTHLQAVKGIGSSSSEDSFAIDRKWGKEYLLSEHGRLLDFLGYTFYL